jgi:hypothetical protein
MKINQALIESYARNLLGQVIAAATIVSSTSHVSITNFGSHEWGLVANSLWASLVPVILRYVNKKDPAFGLVAEQATAVLSKTIAKKTTAKKTAAKKTAKKTAVK